MVVVVASLLAHLSARPMRDYIQRIQFGNHQANIKRLIQTAKSRSMANPQVHCGVYFDVGSSPQRVAAFRDLDDPASHAFDPGPDSLFLLPVDLRPEISLSLVPGYPSAIIFRGDGSAYETARVVLRYKDLEDTLQILASTGQVQVLK